MSTKLRDYQDKSKNDVYQAWADGHNNVLLTAATGAGKTVLFAAILQEYDAPAVLVAHRSELISQAALALNREGVPHSIVAPKSTVNEIIRLEHDTHGYSKFAWRAPIRVAGVDTLVRCNEPWLSSIALCVIDEAHHVAGGNKWAKAFALMQNARALGVTAHAVRADGQGLGKPPDGDGIFDALVVGPHGRQLIQRGYLTDYRLLIPRSDIDFSDVKIGASGDYSINQLRAATHKSKQLVGDVVQHYLREAGGKLGLTFAVDIESANEFCTAYRKAGIPADIITGQTSIAARAAIMRQFRDRKLLQLISVDVLGEGTDVPAVEVVSLARRTASWQLMCQQIGRALRVSVDAPTAAAWNDFTDDQRRAHIAASHKPRATILDHVGNVLYHYERRGMPDALQAYSLARREKANRQRADVIPLRSCFGCFQPYERYRSACPYCGLEHVPDSRGGVDKVDGDLLALDPEVLATLRGEWLRVDGAPASHPDPMISRVILRNHHDRYEKQ